MTVLRRGLVCGVIAAAIVVCLLGVAAAAGSGIIAAIASGLGIIVIASLAVAGYRVAKYASRQRLQIVRRLGLAEERLLELAPLEADLAKHDDEVRSIAADIVELRACLDSLGQTAAKERAASSRNRRDIKILTKRVPAGYLDPVNRDISRARRESIDVLQVVFETALKDGRSPREVLNQPLAQRLTEHYWQHGEIFQVKILIENFEVLQRVPEKQALPIYHKLRRLGYWSTAAEALRQIGLNPENNRYTRTLRNLQRQVAVFAEPGELVSELPQAQAYDPGGPIVHMVGHTLPNRQSGYTLRTHYTAMAQQRRGLKAVVVGQAGAAEPGDAAASRKSVDGIDYYILSGPARSATALDDWIAHSIGQLAALVAKLRPSVLHAHSDFFNALIANAVARQYGIPMVYESRGFWEESWLSRTVDEHGLSGRSEELFAAYGMPEAYALRKHSEEFSRRLADHVFTLADVMRDHILESAAGAIPDDRISIVPNAVDGTKFPVQTRDFVLAAELGIPPDAITIGYISSIVEYEGIDTLIDAFHSVQQQVPTDLRLIIVGDGLYRQHLERQVRESGIAGVTFTGHVEHEKILSHYGLIDIFVVPRKPSQVSHLVTPLKPVEAFATGRAVVMSDVAALRDIAESSQAAELFAAGSADSLSAVLRKLIDNPELRAELSSRAASWVRRERTWDRNTEEYLRVYRSLGYSGPSSTVAAARAGISALGADPDDLVQALANAELPGLNGWFGSNGGNASAAQIITKGWIAPGHPAVPVMEIQDWSNHAATSRSWNYRLHTWRFLDPLLSEYVRSHDQVWLERAVQIALSWVRWQRTAERTASMAWYDMALALRVPRMIAVMLYAARVPSMREATMILVDALVIHFDELHEAFQLTNNHGFYVAASQAHIGRYVGMIPGATRTGVEGRKRLAQMADRQFASDGTHLEHSPGYHAMLWKSFADVIRRGFIDDDQLRERIAYAEHVLGWMVQPNGELVQFGDTAAGLAVDQADVADPETRFMISGGVSGSPPAAEHYLCPVGGYGFVRSPRPTSAEDVADSGYLALMAAFHSKAHKHADDLTVVWYDRGREILTGSGRFGYGAMTTPGSKARASGFVYAEPERQYVEATMAHNTLMMDGRDQQRLSREPYGSGVEYVTEQDGRFDVGGMVEHLDYTHRRHITYRPGIGLLVRDSIATDGSRPRAATLWFNVCGVFELVSAKSCVILRAPGKSGDVELIIDGPGQLITPVRGQRDPLRGWRSRVDNELEPVWSIGFTFTVESSLEVETTLTLAAPGSS